MKNDYGATTPTTSAKQHPQLPDTSHFREDGGTMSLTGRRGFDSIDLLQA